MHATVGDLEAALGKFLETAGELLPAELYLAYLDLLRGLAASPGAAKAVFALLRNNGLHGEAFEQRAASGGGAALEPTTLVDDSRCFSPMVQLVG